MNGSTLFRALAIVLLIAVAIGGGAAVYDAGVNAGIQQAATAAASGQPVAVPPYAYGPYHWGGFGLGFVGFFVWILVFFLFLGLVRAAFGWGRWGGGRGFDGGRWGGPGGPGGPGWPGRRSIEEWHRELHRAESDEPAGPAAG